MAGCEGDVVVGTCSTSQSLYSVVLGALLQLYFDIFWSGNLGAVIQCTKTNMSRMTLCSVSADLSQRIVVLPVES